MEHKDVINFVFELGHLRRIKHEGWRLIGVENPDSVAEHSLRAAQISYILAVMEGYDRPEEVASIVVFHDMEECRTGDLHKVANRYVTVDKERVANDQVSTLGDLGQRILALWMQDRRRDTQAGIIAKDADLLEMAFMAKELMETGRNHAQDWLKNIAGALKTESAKRLLSDLNSAHSADWWQGLKKIG